MRGLQGQVARGRLAFAGLHSAGMAAQTLPREQVADLLEQLLAELQGGDDADDDDDAPRIALVGGPLDQPQLLRWLTSQKARVVATHDCDILNYRRDLLARLCFPTANPNMSYEFAKGYYSRVSDRMHGRVTRLFMAPLMRSMKSVLGAVPLLDYLESFRYPLAGECSMTIELVRANRIPADWGLEVGVLAEVYVVDDAGQVANGVDRRLAANL